MRRIKTRLKKHTIFRMFLIPLILIMLTQSLLTLGILAARRTFGTLQDYSVNMMSRMVENRRVILENDLIRRCSSLYGQEDALSGILEEYLEESGLSLEQMLASQENRRELLSRLLPECLNSVQNIQTTGIFLILVGDDMGAVAEYDGFFVRDSDYKMSTANNTDLLFERGAKELSRTYSVPLNISWAACFRMAGQGQRKADDFFYEPWRAGNENPDADTVDLGYWSQPFILEDSVNDSHEMITYSVPLRYEGQVYGVLGIEISSSVLYDYLPVEELNENEQAGYMLALTHGDGDYIPLVGKGILYNSIATGGSSFVLKDTEYQTLYQVEDILLGDQNIYAVRCPLKLYDSFAPYDDVQWVLLGLNTEDELFGMSHRLYMWIGSSMLLGLAFAVGAIYVIVRHLTRPINKLMGCIDKGGEGLKDFQESNILEIDALYGEIRDLTDRQKEAGNILLEEKERYRVALESTNDIFFTYDIHGGMLDIVNHPTMNGVWDQSKSRCFDMDRVYYEDRSIVRGILEEKSEKVYAEFRYIFSNQNDFQWYALSGKMVSDGEGSRHKLVGRLRNIQSQKEQEMRRQERMERDGVTGLYAYSAGRQRLEQCRLEDAEGVMIYLLLERLQEMNEANGIVFGDMILEELGRTVRERCESLREYTGCRTVAIRVDGDEFVIWLEGLRRSQAESFLQGLFYALGEIFDREIIELHVCAGLAVSSAGVDSVELMRRAKFAQIKMRGLEPGSFLFYEDIPAELSRNLPVLGGKPIISNDYGEDRNLASLALNLFGRGTDFQAQMTLILCKIGYYFGAPHVLTTIIHSDFRSNYLEYQWHREDDPVRDNINQYTDEERDAFWEWLGSEQVRAFTAEESGRPLVRKFLNTVERMPGVALPMYDGGSYMGNVCILGMDPALAEDAGERQKLEEVRNVLQSQINQRQHDLASRAKSDFLSRMSHEIRTPMNGIIGMTTIALQPDQSKERMTDCLNKIQNSSQYLLGLINDILDMSKIESGKMHLEPESFNLRETVESVAELMRPQLEAKEIEFVQEMDISGRCFVGDKMRISQVLINLLSNAVKFTAQQGRIVLTVQEREEKDGRPAVYFAVEDNGIGISREDQKRVFRSFEQAESRSTAKQQGTGLGLSISSRLVQMMGGSIELQSELGKGSRFSFEISMERGQCVEQKAEEQEQISFEGCRVLLVEDNELNREIAQYLLEEQGFAVDYAYNGQEAVDRIRTTAPHTYDVVLMDIMMPVMDGLDATRAIRAMDREDCRTLPIIAMSANAFDDDMKRSVECGMNGHLTKPVEVDKLKKMLWDVLQKKLAITD